VVAGLVPGQPQLAAGNGAQPGGLNGLLDRIFGGGPSAPDPHPPQNYYVAPSRYR
jgi:hypothetical protein